MTFETFYTFDELDAIAAFLSTFEDGATTEEILDAAFEITGREFTSALTEEQAQCFWDEWVDCVW